MVKSVAQYIINEISNDIKTATTKPIKKLAAIAKVSLPLRRTCSNALISSYGKENT